MLSSTVLEIERVVTLFSQLNCGLCKSCTRESHLEVVETYTGVVLLCVPMTWSHGDYPFSCVEQSWLPTAQA